MALEMLGRAPSGARVAPAEPSAAREDGWAAMVKVLAEFREPDYLDKFTKLLVGDLRGTSYEGMDVDEFSAGMRVNMRALISGVLLRRSPEPGDDDAHLRAIGASRANKGVNSFDLIKVILVSQQRLVDEILHHSRARGISEEIVVETLQYVDDWMAWVSKGLIAGHREADLAARARERQRRDHAVRRLLTGGLTPVETAELARECDLDLRSAYLVLCARPSPEGRSAEELRRLLSAAGLALSDQAPYTTLYGQFCAIVPTIPDSPIPLAVGVSPPVNVNDLATGYRLAKRCADAAHRLGHVGFVTMKDLSVKAALTVDHEVVRALRARYLDPLLEMGTAGKAILETVEGYLEHQRSVSATSRALFLHANTIRYRLSKFEAITGCSLRNVQTIVEVWWILQTMRLRPQG